MEDKQPRRWNLSVFNAIRLMNPEALAQALEDQDADQALEQGKTPLTMAAEFPEEDLGLVLTLLDAGARLDLADERGVTPLLSCIKHRNDPMARELLRRGAKTNAQDHDGHTPLMACCASGMTSLADALLNKRADPNVKSHEGLTALMALARAGKKAKNAPTLALATNILAAGADVNAKDDDGHSAIFYAASVGHEELAIMLAAAGAEMTVLNSQSQGPIEAARFHGHETLARLLEQTLSDQESAQISQSALGAHALNKSSTRL
jgi:ankyrin repeat protein